MTDTLMACPRCGRSMIREADLLPSHPGGGDAVVHWDNGSTHCPTTPEGGRD